MELFFLVAKWVHAYPTSLCLLNHTLRHLWNLGYVLSKLSTEKQSVSVAGTFEWWTEQL